MSYIVCELARKLVHTSPIYCTVTSEKGRGAKWESTGSFLSLVLLVRGCRGWGGWVEGVDRMQAGGEGVHCASQPQQAGPKNHYDWMYTVKKCYRFSRPKPRNVNNQTLPHCKENPSYVFLFWKLRGLGPNFHIHVSVSDLYIPRICPHISLQQNRQSDPGYI